MQKCLEKQFQSFFAIFRTLELVWIVRRKHQVLTGTSILCLTSIRKI